MIDETKRKAAAVKSYEAAIAMLLQLNLTEDERITAIYAAAIATENAQLVVAKDFSASITADPDKVLSAALAAALAGVWAKEKHLKGIE